MAQLLLVSCTSREPLVFAEPNPIRLDPTADRSVYLAKLGEMNSLWQSKEPESYEYKAIRGGSFGYSEYLVRVDKGRCFAKSRYGSEEPGRWKKADCSNISVAGLFEDTATQFERGFNGAEIEFDQVWGFVSYFYSEPAGEISDQSWYFQVIDLVPL